MKNSNTLAELGNSYLAVVYETRTNFQLYHVATKFTCPVWTVNSVVELPVKGMVVSSNLTRSVGFSTGLAVLPTTPQA